MLLKIHKKFSIVYLGGKYNYCRSLYNLPKILILFLERNFYNDYRIFIFYGTPRKDGDI